MKSGIYTDKIAITLPTLKRQVAEQDAVFKIFPDAAYHVHNGFSSKSVNKQYNKWELECNSWGIDITAFYEIPFIYDGLQENIKVHSQPKTSRLVHLIHHKMTIYFPKFPIKIRGNELSKKLVKDCHIAIGKFLTDNTDLNYKIDDRHLHTKIKKLISYI